MSVLAPPRHDDPELLIREARARRRKRWLGAALALALLSGGALVLDSILAGSRSSSSTTGELRPATRTASACGVRGVGIRILGRDGRTLYREPGRWAHPNRGFPTIRCVGPSIWAVFVNGEAAGGEGYFGVHSGDSGRTWRPVFGEWGYPKAPHRLDAYLRPWTLHGHAAYFVGECPACTAGTGFGTVSLAVTKDGGRSFHSYDVRALRGKEWGPTRIRVSGGVVTIWARRIERKVNRPPYEIYAHKTVTLRVG